MTKPIYKSKTIQASASNIVAVVVMLVAFLGVDVDQGTQADIVVLIIAGWKLINDAVAIYGRITAKHELTIDGKSKLKINRLPVILLCGVALTGAVAASEMPTYDFQNITGPAVILVDWNNPKIILNHPISGGALPAPQLADAWFDELKATLEIKVNKPEDADELLMLILSKVDLHSITVDSTQ